MYHLEDPYLNEKHSVHTADTREEEMEDVWEIGFKQKVSGEKESHRWQHKHRSTLLLKSKPKNLFVAALQAFFVMGIYISPTTPPNTAGLRPEGEYVLLFSVFLKNALFKVFFKHAH